MKRILLIRPPEHYLPHRQRPMAYLPLGLLYIAAVLIKKGYEVDIVDGIMPQGRIKKGENFFGITFDDIKKRVEKIDFDIVGISAQFTFQWANAIKTAEICKKIRPKCKVIMGGAHVSFAFSSILRDFPFVDIVVKGEGEYVMPQLVESLRANLSLEGITGVAYRDKGFIFSSGNIFIEDLDSLPFPAYNLVDIERYFWLTRKYFTRTSYHFPGWERGVTIITSRGCPFSCVFCSIHLHMGRKWRAHSPEYILRHIDYLVKNYNIKYLHFEDDNFTLEPKRCQDILKGMVDRKWDLRWDTPNGVRGDTFDVSLLEECKSSGCTHLIFGIESGNQRVLDEVIKKRLKLSCLEKVLAEAKRIGVDVKAFYIVGLPGETKEEIKNSVRYALKLILKYECFGGFSMAVPLPGTELYNICSKFNYFYCNPTIDNLSGGFTTQGIIKTDEFSPYFLKRMIKIYSLLARFLKIIVFLKKLIRDPYLILYFLSKIFTNPSSRWSLYYNKIVNFHHALMYDLKKKEKGR